MQENFSRGFQPETITYIWVAKQIMSCSFFFCVENLCKPKSWFILVTHCYIYACLTHVTVDLTDCDKEWETRLKNMGIHLLKNLLDL